MKVNLNEAIELNPCGKHDIQSKSESFFQFLLLNVFVYVLFDFVSLIFEIEQSSYFAEHFTRAIISFVVVVVIIILSFFLSFAVVVEKAKEISTSPKKKQTATTFSARIDFVYVLSCFVLFLLVLSSSLCVYFVYIFFSSLLLNTYKTL